MKKLRKTAAASAGPDAAAPIAQATVEGSSWSYGRSLGQKAVTGLLYLGIACGVLALGMQLLLPPVKPAAAVSTAEGGLTVVQQQAGAYATGFVGAWLSATRQQPGTLLDYIDESTTSMLSESAWVYRDLGVVSVDPVDETGVVSVVVAANIEEYDMTSDDGLTFWPRRYFSVPVRIADAGLAVVALPTPVAAPLRDSANVQMPYTKTVSPNTPARATVEAFLAAYLAGSGDITRVISPGSTINAVLPAPYQELKVTDVRSDKEASETPAGGDVVHVFATADVTSASGQRLTTTYALTLTARDGRWETTTVDLAPQERSTGAPSSKSTPTPTPSR
ncbi:MAG: conjugal transfer protein [Actinobacteria bacterium]|nr:conjugal transfer protein [Actinomycetota bacterium]